MVEWVTVNDLVVGSSPAGRASRQGRDFKQVSKPQVGRIPSALRTFGNGTYRIIGSGYEPVETVVDTREFESLMRYSLVV